MASDDKTYFSNFLVIALPERYILLGWSRFPHSGVCVRQHESGTLFSFLISWFFHQLHCCQYFHGSLLWDETTPQHWNLGLKLKNFNLWPQTDSFMFNWKWFKWLKFHLDCRWSTAIVVSLLIPYSSLNLDCKFLPRWSASWSL